MIVEVYVWDRREKVYALRWIYDARSPEHTFRPGFELHSIRLQAGRVTIQLKRVRRELLEQEALDSDIRE